MRIAYVVFNLIFLVVDVWFAKYDFSHGFNMLGAVMIGFAAIMAVTLYKSIERL